MGKIKIKKRIPVIQIGSFLQQNFGEKITKHGYGILTVKDMVYEYKDIQNPKPFLSFKIKSIEDLEKGNEQLVNY